MADCHYTPKGNYDREQRQHNHHRAESVTHGAIISEVVIPVVRYLMRAWAVAVLPAPTVDQANNQYCAGSERQKQCCKSCPSCHRKLAQVCIRCNRNGDEKAANCRADDKELALHLIILPAQNSGN